MRISWARNILVVTAVAGAASVTPGCAHSAPDRAVAPQPEPTSTTTPPPPAVTNLISSQVPTTTKLLVLRGPTPVSAALGGPPVGTEPGVLFDAPEALPMIAATDTWAQVLLPGPPNGGTGWIPLSAGEVQDDPWFIEVNLATRQVSAYANGALVMTAPGAIGAPTTPTPTPPGGLTFITGSLRTVGQYRVETPVLRALALELTGPGAQLVKSEVGGTQVAIHGWKGEQADARVWGPANGLAVSHGCVRVPRDFALGPMTAAPNGTLVRFVTA